MTILLSEIKPKTLSNESVCDVYEFTVNCPKSKSRGYKKSISLRCGLNFTIWDFQLQEELVEEKLPFEPSTTLEFGFNLSGNYPGGLSNWPSFLKFGPTERSERCIREWSAGQRVLKVDLCLTEPSILRTSSSIQLELTPPELRQIIESSEQEIYCENLGTITPAVQLVLQQIFKCPYQGWTQQIYLEGKALELIALQTAQALYSGKGLAQPHHLRRSDIDRIYQARDLLIHNLNNPPSLLDLAHQVGLNDCTLKRGFRQIFGTTVFGYLRNQRMAQARQLLMEGEMNVVEVACAVGYSHPGYFAAAFKREFGINPKSFHRS